MTSDATRAARVVENARQKLEDLARIPESASIRSITRAVVKAGDAEGVGALLRLAALRPSRGNALSKTAMVRFRAESERCFDGLQKLLVVAAPRDNVVDYQLSAFLLRR